MNNVNRVAAANDENGAEVHAWAVCAAITTPEDMAENFPRIVAIPGHAQAVSGRAKGEAAEDDWTPGGMG